MLEHYIIKWQTAFCQYHNNNLLFLEDSNDNTVEENPRTESFHGLLFVFVEQNDVFLLESFFKSIKKKY